jgi:Na+-driven multidrug efflux pump
VLVLAWLALPFVGWTLAEPMGFGLAGLGLAQGLVFWVATLAMGIVVLRGGAGFVPILRQRPRAAIFAKILSVGLVASGLAVVANLATILVTAQMAAYGAVAVAAYGISARLEFLMIPLAFGVGSALTALVGRAAGAGDWAEARALAWTGAGLALVLTGLAGLVVALWPLQVASLFSGDPAVVAIAARGLGYVGFAFGGFGLGMALYFASQGAGRMAYPVAGAFSRLALAVGGGALLAGPLGLGIEGHFLGVALGITAYGAVTALGVRRAVWPGRA